MTDLEVLGLGLFMLTVGVMCFAPYINDIRLKTQLLRQLNQVLSVKQARTESVAIIATLCDSGEKQTWLEQVLVTRIVGTTFLQIGNVKVECTAEASFQEITNCIVEAQRLSRLNTSQKSAR